MTLPTHTVRALVAGVLLTAGALALGACESTGAVESQELSGASEQGGEELTGTVTAGADVRTIANVNLRSTASTTGKVLRVIPEGALVSIVQGAPSHSFYKVTHDGLTGWVYGKYITLVDEGNGDGDQSDPGSDPNPPTPPVSSTRDKAIARAKSGVGFSYWWGHGRWRPEGASSGNRGSCSGSCPSCGHSGSYGSDCSGFIAKVWQVPSDNDDVTVDKHPYGTTEFNGSTSQWSVISRDNLKPADALVYRSGSAGHIVLFSSGDSWGSMHTYECKGCSAGCVYNLRTASSAYKGIRRKGW